MKTATRILIAIAIAAALAAGYYYWSQRNNASVLPPEATQSETPASAEQTEQTPETPAWEIQHPIEATPAEEPLPAVRDSDSLIAPPLASLVGNDLWRNLFYPDEIIRRIVTTVDNLPRREASTKLWPVQPAGTWMETTGSDDKLVISPTNTKRYAQYMTLVQNVSVEKTVSVYRKFYPLFQQAYVDLGYPDAYFNDRLVVAIDNLLATPEHLEAPRLLQDKVIYQFADPDLEKRSAGQKIMLRIGVENAQIVKLKLRELRTAITRQPVAAH